MVNNHYERSLVNKVFVSSCSNASFPFSERDVSNECEVLNQLTSVHGDTKGKLLNKKKTKIRPLIRLRLLLCISKFNDKNF
ncbi:hypothetical protein EDC94DRAFT_602700 [Helicostylum pulchrum]|nr:hypothetical protein EDC94DRAFT_602700 [Helicostylum pulchrum]